MNKRHVGPVGAATGTLNAGAERPGNLLDALTEDQFNLWGLLTAKACASFEVHHQRYPDKFELEWIATRIARAILAPSAATYEVQ